MFGEGAGGPGAKASPGTEPPGRVAGWDVEPRGFRTRNGNLLLRPEGEVAKELSPLSLRMTSEGPEQLSPPAWGPPSHP